MGNKKFSEEEKAIIQSMLDKPVDEIISVIEEKLKIIRSKGAVKSRIRELKK